MRSHIVGSAEAAQRTVATLPEPVYEHEETRNLVALVTDAAELVRARGEEAFDELRVFGSRWRHEETYVFVLDRDGNMLVHPDASLEGKNTELTDVNGKPIIRGLIGAATRPGKPEGWYHYQWPVPDGLLPRWKSSYVRLVAAPSGASYIVGSGMYNDRMERAFVVDAVTAAVSEIERDPDAFATLRDPRGPFIAKDAYVFVIDQSGIDLVNPAFPNLEGRDLLDVTDTDGKPVIREMFDVVRASGSGWVDYMWPKPGESVSTQKSTYVSKASWGDTWVIVGCGVYLADAPKASGAAPTMSASELMRLVREAAATLEARGQEAFPEFRTKGSRWFRDDTYFFVWTRDGTVVIHAAEPAREGTNDRDLHDVLGRKIGEMILQAASSPSGEGWIHYMYPEPGGLFPAWKSTFVKRVTLPSGKRHIIGCGIYNMRMDRAFVEDVVNRAAALIAQRGNDAFPQLRDRKGPFVFMDTYVFVLSTKGIQLVNPAQPSLEGRNLSDLRDITGKAVIRDEMTAALTHGSAWLECYWYKVGDNTPALKHTYVRAVRSGAETYIVGSGVYLLA